ncbi:2168_t:CDS:2 [Funneliformis caledonium]|uniref:2168_t:CDS:1 n=1 Tax=Funneliformis caledonium TaxID=1117310 RepID=A0A9N8VN47_9GLOM|nr:2168_t:CDS:2 [Funneliformis caledonium]
MYSSSNRYVKLVTHVNQKLAKIRVIEDSLDPIWNETHFLILSTLNEVLRLELWEFNELGNDKPLGMATLKLKMLLTNPVQENITSPVLFEGKSHCEINFDAIWYPVAEIKDEEPSQSNGVLRFNIHQAKDLDPGRFLTNNPAWEITIIIRDEKDFLIDPVVCKWESTLDQFLENIKERVEWFNIIEPKIGKLRLICLWKPVIMDHIPGNNRYDEPCGFGSGIGNVIAGRSSFVGCGENLVDSGLNLVGSGANAFVSGAGNIFGTGFCLLKKPKSEKSDQSDQSEKSDNLDKSEKNVTSRFIDREEKCTININDPSTIINLSVRHHKAKSKDIDIGSYEFKVNEHIQPRTEKDF